MSTFPSFTEFTQSFFYRLIHKILSSNWIQIQDCISLQSVTIYGNPKIGTDAFWGVLANVTMNLTASQIDNDYWTTFYNDGYNFQADGNTTVYKGTVNESSLMLTEVEDKIVNRRTAVILKSSDNPVMTLTESGSSDTNGNDLRGISDRTKRTSVISNFSANEIYTMGYTSAGFGFQRNPIFPSLFMASVRIALPSLRALTASTGLSKNIQTCAPLPEWDRSMEYGTFQLLHTSTKANTSS